MLWLTALLEDSVSVGYTTDLPMSQPVMKAKRSNTQAMMISCIGVRCSGLCWPCADPVIIGMLRAGLYGYQ